MARAGSPGIMYTKLKTKMLDMSAVGINCAARTIAVRSRERNNMGVLQFLPTSVSGATNESSRH